MSQTPHPLRVHCNGKETVGSCQVDFYTARDAFFQGLKMFVLMLLAAILSIVLPGMHFVTVPLGVLASPLVGIYVFVTRKGAVRQMTGNFFCPECHAEDHVAFRGAPPYSSKCVECQHDFQVTPLL
jgi:hypothetical protein